MSSPDVPGFQSFLLYFASFCNGQVSHQQHNKGKRKGAFREPYYAFQESLTLMLVVANFAYTNTYSPTFLTNRHSSPPESSMKFGGIPEEEDNANKLKEDANPGKWVLI